MLIRIGVPRETVAFIGRWGSAAILHYIEEVTVLNAALTMPHAATDQEPAEPEPQAAVARAEQNDTATEDRLEEIWGAFEYEAERLRKQARALDRKVARVNRRTTHVAGKLAQLEAEVSALPGQERLEQLEAVVCSLPSMQDVETRLSQVQRGPRYVRWTKSIKHHIVASGHPLDPPHWHKTRCGRYFGIARTSCGRTSHPQTRNGVGTVTRRRAKRIVDCAEQGRFELAVYPNQEGCP